MATFRVNYKGLEKMLTADWMQAEMLAKAEKVKERAESIAPYDPTSKDGEHYRDRFTASSGIKDVAVGKAVNHGGHTRRAYGRVTNTDPDALNIEYGSEKVTEKRKKPIPRHRTLGKALDALNGGG